MEKKNIGIIGVSVVLLVAVVATIAVVTHHGGSSSTPAAEPQLSSSVKSIKEFCKATDYQQTCQSELESAAGNATTPTDLAKLIFNVTSNRIKSALNQSVVLAELAKDKRTSGALENCRELLEYAVDDLQTSFQQLGGFQMTNFKKAVDDLKTWLTAALTYQDTCLDGFENTTTNAGDSMRKALNSSIELTANILAIVDEFSSTVQNLEIPLFSRRLLSDGDMPSWMSAGRRRLLQASPSDLKPNVTVAKDGSGDYKTINDALAAAPEKSKDIFVIYIKEGVYAEYVTVNRSKPNIAMIGDGATKTKITGNRNFMQNITTKDTATFAAIGDGFFARDIGIENTAGPENHQAVALRVQSDQSVFYHCRFDGYQDTLYAHALRQFFRECTITGTIDFIFGNAQVVIQNSQIIVRKPMDNQQNIVTAQGRKEKRAASAIIIQNCTVSADPAYYPVRNKIPTYLGRPWKEYSRTIYLQNQLDDLINPQGWLPWLGDYGLKTCFYAELDNHGPGADMSKRAKWRGVKSISYDHAQQFTVEHFIQGQLWLPHTGVPFIPGLLPLSESGRIH
ncbi:probable pectinesterase/pectinesterase inhibitor 21 [Typha latifolia]|uniref:probable pectinesterase/pectinesterase inhibitor 21 n=1 Tax=Typha latifolia TaxID=4733 RepID=UPI003C2B7761